MMLFYKSQQQLENYNSIQQWCMKWNTKFFIFLKPKVRFNKFGWTAKTCENVVLYVIRFALIKAYFRHLLRVVTIRSAQFEFAFWHFHISKTLIFMLFRGVSFWFALNILKFALFVNTTRMPRLSRICLANTMRKAWYKS